MGGNIKKVLDSSAANIRCIVGRRCWRVLSRYTGAALLVEIAAHR